MHKQALLLSGVLPLMAVPAPAQRPDWTPRPAVGKVASVAVLPTKPRVTVDRVDSTARAPFRGLAEVVSAVLEHVRVKDTGTRLAPDLRLDRRSVDVITPVPPLSGSALQVRLSVGLGLARLSSAHPLGPGDRGKGSRSSLLISGGVELCYGRGRGWRLILALRDRLAVNLVSSSRTAASRRPLPPVEALLPPGPISVGVELGLP